MKEPQPIIELDGTKIAFAPLDLDGDGFIGDVELLPRGSGEGNVSFIQQKSDLAQSLEILDDDSIDPQTRMSNIDMNAHLAYVEKNALGVIDFLVSVGFLPDQSLALTRQMKRLSVSVGGRGREQKVAMVTGDRAHAERAGGGGSLIDKAKAMFKKD